MAHILLFKISAPDLIWKGQYSLMAVLVEENGGNKGILTWPIGLHKGLKYHQNVWHLALVYVANIKRTCGKYQ
jgi:hypothetical protein